MRYRVITADGRTLLFRDDGYRIHARYLEGRPDNVDPDEWMLVAEYKQCDRAEIGKIFSDVVMGLL